MDEDPAPDPPERGRDRRAFLMALGAGTAAVAGGLPLLSPAAGARASRTSRLLRQLAGETRGRLTTRGDRGYRTVSQVFNTRFDGIRPLAVLRAANEADVIAAVRWAATNSIPIAARSGGHSYGGYSTVRNGLVVDLSALDHASVDVRRRTARIGAGMQLIDFYAALARRGVTVPGGSCPTVGIAGLTLGGGVGMAARRWGTTSDNLLSLRIVTADGRVRTADSRRNADLYWASRGGGGGNFGIATSFRFRTHAVRAASYFFLDFPWSEAVAVVRRWQRWAPEAPPELYSICAVETGADAPQVRVFGQWFGTEEALRRELHGLTGEVRPTGVTIGTEGYLDLMKRWAGCLGLSVAQCHLSGTTRRGTLPRDAFFAKSAYVERPMSDEGAREMVRQIDLRQTQSAIGSGAFLLDSYGGALNEPSPTATAFVHRDNICSIQYFTQWTSPSSQRQSIAWLQGAYRATAPYVSRQAYQNYIDPTLKDWRRAYYAQNYGRLVAVKRRYDPDEVFRFAQGIPA